MTPVPPKLRKQLAADPEYQVCSLYGYHECGGRITWEHAIIYAGRQVQERWAIIPLCARGQEVDQYQDDRTMNKQMNRWVALNRASDEDLARFDRAPFRFERDRLNATFGEWGLKAPVPKITGIAFSV